MGEMFSPQGEERVTKKYTLPCSRYDVPTVEAWLAEKTADGWWLCDWSENSVAPVFVKREAEDRQYWLEPVQKDAPPSADEIARHEMMGWTYLCRSHDGLFYVWRSAAASARKSRLKPMEESFALRKVRKSVLRSYLSLLALVLLLAGAALFIDICSSNLVWRLVADTKIGLDILTFALSFVGAFWADWWERRALRRLKRSLAEGEPMRGIGRTGTVGKIVQWLPLAIAIAMLVPLAVEEEHVSRLHDYADNPVPFITAEQLGGTASNERYVEQRHTLLGGEITLVSEGRFAGSVEHYLWVQYSTQLEVYEPQLRFLAKPLADEVYTQYFKGCTAEELDSEYSGKAYYSGDPNSGTQRILLCDGGVVLYYHTDAPDDLREHLDEFATLLCAYQND